MDSSEHPPVKPVEHSHSNKTSTPKKSNLIDIPTIQLPKGGGAIKGISEKFSVNAANGTASFSLPLPFSHTRSNFAPKLSLAYNSGSGNSPFGLGWNIDLPSIHRRTEKLLPAYEDGEESDVFQFSGVEDLVPAYYQDAQQHWLIDAFNSGTLAIKRYKPRIEGSFNLIERITQPDNTCYWKITSKDNIVTYYGYSKGARLVDPQDETRIFKWLPDICFDDKGNCYAYTYKAEGSDNVANAVHEKNRLSNPQSFANTYLKSVRYGNKAPFTPSDLYTPAGMEAVSYLFDMVIDYGDHHNDLPAPAADLLWPMRLDPFSNCKPGFEIRTYRLCKRFLFFHDFLELDAKPVLVRSVELQYKYFDFSVPVNPADPALIEAELVTAVKEVSWLGNGTAGYQTKAYPPATFTYNLPEWNHQVQTIAPESLDQAPVGLGAGYQFTDLWNEGIPGILTEQGESLYYKSNLGDGRFTQAVPVTPTPSLSGLSNGTMQLSALEADGRKFFVHTEAPVRGYYEIADDSGIFPFQAFDDYPVIDFKDANTKFLDLNGDGRPDIIISEENVFRYYPSLGISGYDSAEIAPKPFDEELGPAIVFADPVQCIFLADMNADGLTDIVRIRNGEICYWPNMGYGRFGAKVNMMNAPVFDTLDRFNPAYLHLADINGTGASDVLYLGLDTFKAWLNLGGNGWAEPVEWEAFPSVPRQNELMVADLLGKGTACIVWSSPLPQNAVSPMRYIDLMGGNKPYLMTQYSNGMGKTAVMTYKESTFFYLQDKMNGTPWITRLPFPVHVINNTTTTDSVSGTSYGSSYSYHHGYYDHAEKEFRGFGRVEQTDLETYDAATAQAFDQVPVLTKTWYHTGIYFDAGRILGLYTKEYFQNSQFSEYLLPQPVLPAGLDSTELREAARACKGMMLRQEVYALDQDIQPELYKYPYTVTEHNSRVLLMQPLLDNRDTVFMSLESEQIAYHYERNPADPRIVHTLNTGIDPEYGFLLHSFHVVYGRQPVPDLSNPGGWPIPGGQQLPAIVLTEQQKPHITFETNNYTNGIITPSAYRLPVTCDTVSYEATGTSPQNQYYSLAELAALINTNNEPLAPLHLRKIKQERTLFLNDDLVTPLKLGEIDALGFHYQTFQLVFDSAILNNYAGLVTDQILSEGKYIKSNDYKAQLLFPATDPDGEWWSPSGTVGYLQNNLRLPFCLPYQYTDNFGHTTTILHDAYWLTISKTIDPAGNEMTVQNFDYRTFTPQKITDINHNITEISFDIHGMVAGLAMEGKGDNTEGDNLDGFDPDAQSAAFFDDPYANAAALLGNATFRYIYDYSVLPFRTASLVRENHVHHFTDVRLQINPGAVQMSFEYTDGFGRSAMKKIQAENYPATGKNNDCEGDGIKRRWIGTGKTVYNNKGNAVKQYEPFFSDTNAYEEAPANGVTPVMFFDATGRTIRTNFPDGTFSTVVFDPWMEVSYDRNDLVKDSDWYAWRMDPANPLSADVWEVDAADKAAVHYSTPGIQHLDSLGRGFYSVILNKGRINDPVTALATYSVLDIEGNPLQVIDARQNVVMAHVYDMANRPFKQVSQDAGTKYTLNDGLNKNYYKWDNNNGLLITLTTTYDELHRPVNNCIAIGNSAPVIFEHMVYGEGIIVNGQPDVVNNFRGQIYQHYDSAGLLTNHLFDFKGSVLQAGRRFTKTYKPAQSDAMQQPVVWTGNTATDDALLENDEYVSLTRSDATNRVLMNIRSFKVPAPAGIIQAPYTAATVNGSDITVHGYSLSGHLKTVDVYKGGGNIATNYISRICHNEKGQRLCIQYGNNTVTRYTYDPLNFHMTRLLTTRNKGTDILQDITYNFDPVG
ncbi:MAG: SpvB/TcaC N-terminal domain-containing protein, partial [Bacteroidota bacterium]